MKKRFIALALSSAFLTIQADAADRPKKIGWAPWFSNLTVKDPDGNTASTTTSEPLSAMFVLPAKRDRRWVITGAFYDFELDASTDEIGQNVEGYSLAAWHQWRFPISRTFKPWFGLGAQADITDINARHRVDAAGFLIETFPDESQTAFGISLNGSQEFNITKDFDLGINAQYVYPATDGGLEGASIGVSILYRL